MRHQTTGFMIDNKNVTKWELLKKYIRRDKYLLLLITPVLLYFIIFKYIPMFGIIIAFQNYLPGSGFFNNEWVGFKWFEQFFNSIYFFRLLRNTFVISFYNLVWGFPVPIIFALLLNEAKDGLYKRTVQTVLSAPFYFPCHYCRNGSRYGFYPGL